MSFRFGAIGALVLAFALGACATAGNGEAGAEGAMAPQFSEEDLPPWMQNLPEGTEPRDNEHTNQATLFLVQAMQEEDEEQARRRYQQALDAATEGIQADPENPQSYFQAGEAHLGLGNLEEAAAMFDRAEEIYPRYIWDTEVLREEAWIEEFNRGAELSQAGDSDAALPHFERAHMIYQGRPEAMLNLAEAYTSRERLEEAADLYAQAIEIMTGPRAEEMDEEVTADWDAYLEVGYFNLAQILFLEERYGEAAEIYEMLLEQDPENLLALSNLAVAYSAAGNEAGAQELYDQLLQRPDLDASDYFMIGVGLYQTDEWMQSSRAFGEAWERVPNHRDAAFNYAQTLFLAEEWEELMGMWDRLIELDPHSRRAYQFQIRALAGTGQEQAAVAVIEQMEELPFYIDGLELHPVEGGVVLVGALINNRAEPGTTVNLTVHFYDVENSQVGTAQASGQLGEPEEAVQFQAELATNQSVFGYRYEVR